MLLSLCNKAVYVVTPPYTWSKAVMILFNDPSPSSIIVMAVQCGLPSKVLRTGSLIHVVECPVIVGCGIVRCGISENGKIQFLLVITGVMASFLVMPVVGMVSISFLSSLPVGNCCVTRRLHAILYNIIRLTTTVLNHILWCRI